ncbi:MAG: NUMOD4 motif-containing HNH endonuclease [Candidatus Micrarchaeia archaeon]|jgi:hypothetical protein
MTARNFNTTEEVWKPIPDFPDYQVSSFGRILSRRPWGHGARHSRIINGSVTFQGYREVSLYYSNGRRRVHVHVLVCEVFYGPRPSERHEAAHWDGNKLNNRASNLRWATHEENTQDKVRQGIEWAPHRKLSEKEVIDIRARLQNKKKGDMTNIAKELGLNRQTIENIYHRRTWKWL